MTTEALHATSPLLNRPCRTLEEVMSEKFHRELTALLNRYSMENGSDTPDYILSTYMQDCLDAFNTALTLREKWYGRKIGGLTAPAITPPPGQ